MTVTNSQSFPDRVLGCGRRRWPWLILASAVVVAAWFSPPARGLRRHFTVHDLYVQAVGAYMARDIEASRAIFSRIACDFGTLPVGALAELKVAFLVYDEDRDLERAESLFKAFLTRHPEGVVYVPQWPSNDYEGELELVAWFFLGQIAQERHRDAEALRCFNRVLEIGSRNRANLIVAEVESRVRMMETNLVH